MRPRRASRWAPRAGALPRSARPRAQLAGGTRADAVPFPTGAPGRPALFHLPPAPQVSIRPEVVTLFLETRPPEEPAELIAAVERLGQRSALKNVERKIKVAGRGPRGPPDDDGGLLPSCSACVRTHACTLMDPLACERVCAKPYTIITYTQHTIHTTHHTHTHTHTPHPPTHPCTHPSGACWHACSCVDTRVRVQIHACASAARPTASIALPTPHQVALPEKEKKARKRRQQAPRTVTNVHMPELFHGAAPETIDS